MTPTHIRLSGPELEAKNRVLRKYSQKTDYFIRVQFSDEEGEEIKFNTKVNNDQIYQRFKQVLQKGFMVGGRQYTFFGFSHSSLRSHSAWFNAPFFQDGTLHFHSKMIQDLGKFSHIRAVARCAARIGQAFSETPYAISMKDNDIMYEYISDLKSPDGKRVFSDGNGTISGEAMEAIWRRLPSAVGVTAFQIRFGGIKGIISLDALLEGRRICIRKESMEKFISRDMADLEICGMANRPIKLVLNRQNIKILEDMGVDKEWFSQLLACELDNLSGVTKNIYNTSIFMMRQSIGDGIEFPKFLRRLERWGIDFKTDQLLCSIVESVVLKELRLLKNKARIPVPQGVTLFGVIDETGYLEENEVYVTYSSCNGLYASPPGDGVPMLVTRSPALHPGDIQKAYNKIPPNGHPLSYLVNCVVFSQKGDRDLPSMLSGGDLDGDLYHIIWDPKIFQNKEGFIRMYVPADYSRPELQDIGRQVEQADIAEFFVEFMKQDQLGLICNRHMILADQEDKGTLHKKCVALAELASQAVDFSKTGIPADVEKLRSIKMQRARPDL